MPTVISDPARLVFMHIPKCGGSTIGPQLAAQLSCDPYFLQTSWIDHPRLGKLMPSHVPLWALRDAFPEALAKIRAYDGFAICREPQARFLSAFAQHLREVRRLDISQLDRAGVAAVLDRVIAAFAEGPQALLHEYIHFVPQSDFVALEGERLIGTVYRLEDLAAFGTAIGARAGVAVDGREHHNKTNHYRSPGVKRAIARLRPVAEKLLPRGLFRATRRAVLAAATVPVQDNVRQLMETPKLADFIARTYAGDAALYAASARTEAANRG